MSLRIGVDTGGTFTDLCAFDETTGQLHVRKVSSTPADPGAAINRGLGNCSARSAARRSRMSAISRTAPRWVRTRCSPGAACGPG